MDVQRLTVLHQKQVSVWNDESGAVRWWDAKREGKTFNVSGHVPGNHLVQQFGHAIDNWGLEHVTRVSADAGLTKTA